MPRKIKVVDVVTDNSDETATNNTVRQLEPISEEDKQTDTVEVLESNETQNAVVQEKAEPTVEEAREVQDIEEVPKTKVRTNELHECPKCGKFMTLKTLKYTHEKTCGIVREPPPKKEKPAPKPRGRPKKENTPAEAEEVEVEETPAPEPAPQLPKPAPKLLPTLTPEPVKSFEELRRERLRERVKRRSESIHKLFLQPFLINLFNFYIIYYI